MPLNIKYGLELEEQRLKNTLDRYLWYKKMGYNPRFPADIIPKSSNHAKIYSALKNEYDEKIYQKTATEIIKKFSIKEKKFYSNLQTIFGKKIRSNYSVILTQYGVSGSYSLPNKIILNINSKSKIHTIFHEIVHLIIEPYIQKYTIEQNQKERIVDLILTTTQISLSHYKKQKRGEKFKKNIDHLFKLYFKAPINIFFQKLDELTKASE